MSTVLIVLVALLAPLSVLAVWAEREIGDTDGYVSAMAPLASESAVRNAVADRIAEEVVRQAGAGPLSGSDAGPLPGSMGELVHDAVLSFAGTEPYRTAWNTVNRAAHTAVEQALTSADSDPASIDLAPVIDQVKRQLSLEGVPFADRIPVVDARVAVVDPDRLGAAREAFHDLQLAWVWLPLLTVLLAVAAYPLARRRLPALVVSGGLGVALAVGGLLLRLAVAVGRVLVLRDLPPDVDLPAAGAVFDALTSTLRTASWWLMGLGVVVGAVVWRRLGRTGAGTRAGAP
ncbi:hypothetical protein ACWF94_24595 [Streptomyces sp. NPDC055078]